MRTTRRRIACRPTSAPRGQNLLFLTLLLSTLSHAFVTSNRFGVNDGRGNRRGLQQRGGSMESGTVAKKSTSSRTLSNGSPSSTKLRVMRMPPPPGDLMDAAAEPPRNGRKEGNERVNVKLNGVSPSSKIILEEGELLRELKNGHRNGNGYSERNGKEHRESGNIQQKPRARAEYVAETKLPTEVGSFQLRGYKIPGAPIGQEPCVIYARDKPPMGSAGSPSRKVPVRVHDQCITSEVFGSRRCDCKEQLLMALNYLQEHGGCVIYLQQEGRGIGLANKIAAYSLQDGGLDTVDANLHLGFDEDEREYDIVRDILEDMNIESIQLMTNNPYKVDRLTELGINVDRTLPMVVPAANPYNRKYLETKEKRMAHANLASVLLTPRQKESKDGRQGPMLVDQPLSNRIMTPRKTPLAEQYINNGTELSANAVHVSLMVDEIDEDETETEDEEEGAEGVMASNDGYCFGRQSVEDAIAAVARGELVVVVDDMNRENEGDFIMAADMCTDLNMAQIVRYSSGVVCVALEDERLQELGLPAMVSNNEDPKETAFTVTVDATKAHGITTGISAADRAKSIRLLADPRSTASDFSRPGHIFPLRSRPGGVLVRDGHTEAALDLARLAGRSPAGVLCEIVSEESPTEMMRLPEMRRFCRRHGFVMTSIVDLAQYRRDTGR